MPPSTLDDILAENQQALHRIFGGEPISRDALVALVRTTVDGLWNPRAQHFVFAGDGMYSCPTRAELEALLTDSLTDVPPYLTTVMDCDDFAWRLKVFANERARANGRASSYAVGVVWRTEPTRARQGHAYNWAVVDTGNGVREFVIIEPQTGATRALDPKVDRHLDLVCC